VLLKKESGRREKGYTLGKEIIKVAFAEEKGWNVLVRKL